MKSQPYKKKSNDICTTLRNNFYDNFVFLSSSCMRENVVKKIVTKWLSKNIKILKRERWGFLILIKTLRMSDEISIELFALSHAIWFGYDKKIQNPSNFHKRR